MNISIRNSVVVALTQTGVLVIGILGVAASNRLASKLGFPSLGESLFFINYGWLLMPVPLVWITVTGWLLTHRRSRDGWKTAAFMTGRAIAVLLIGGAVFESWLPWSHASDAVSMTAIDR